ncbi:L-serine dehydratase/L-threonine deaminase-like [Bradysia coprophila]|uniref:L-serine dehydratase/L-threonine deaminase-like n=2 Tax=Bradysia coprophila TaxID=38358 RepID=UPI00187D6ECC|nr:L-serine dehydratase/L-threonine deaminase-like [Bradysia coprophila]
MTRMCSKRRDAGYKKFISFSGGNAGISLAYVASQMNIPCHIIVPSFVSERITNRMKSLGAVVETAPDSRQAQLEAIRLADSSPEYSLIHPYDDEDLWDGYSTIIDEIKKQLNGKIPSCLLLSVGGGGMLLGFMTGLKRHGWEDIPIIAVETFGAHCLNKSIIAGKSVDNVMTSIAKTLGAPSVAPKVLENLPNFRVISEVQPDSAAIEACLKFSDDHAFCVEPSCGVTLSVIYEGLLPGIMERNGFELLPDRPVVVLVCGGQDASVKILKEYAEKLNVPIQ